MLSNQTVEVRLLGQRIILKSTESNPQFIQAVVELATQKVLQAESRSKSVAPHQVALLALLDLAEEYLKAKNRTAQYQQEVDLKSERLLQMIEAELR